MNRLVIVGMAALAVSCGRGATESHNSSQAGATARAGQANPAGQPTVTIIGCLENADRPEGEPVGTAGGGSKKNAPDQKNAGAGAIGERYTLTRAASESPASNPAASSYILDGNISDLRAHVEQQVRVQGELDAAAANTAGPQRIRVSSVEMIADTCTKR